jgi:PAS domain S-box-containing protein
MKRETKNNPYKRSVSSHPELSEQTNQPTEDVVTDAPVQNANKNLQHWTDRMDYLLRREDPLSVSASYSELQHLQMLRTIERGILLSNSIEEIGQNILPLVNELFPAAWIGLTAPSFSSGEMYIIAAHPTDRNPGQGWHGPLEWNWDAHYELPGPVHSVRDTNPIHHTSPFFSALWEQGIQSLLTVPLLFEGKIWGFLSLGRNSPYRWSLDDVDLAREIATPLAIRTQRLSEFTKLELKASDQEYWVARRTEDFKTNRALFQSIFENTKIGIALINTEGLILDANQILLNLLGYQIVELRGKSIGAFLVDDPEREEVQASFSNVFRSGLPSYDTESQCKRKNGQYIPCRLSYTVMNETAENKLAIFTVEDLSEQKQNQAVILQAEKLSITGKLAASLIHEINNPLQSAIGCLHLTEEVVSEGGDITKYLRVASEELDRAARIVSQLRDLNQPHSMEKSRSVQIQDLLEHTLMLVSKQCKDRGVRVTYHEMDRSQTLPLVPEPMQQVFLNLVLNAIDAMSTGGELDIYPTLSISPSGVSISFTDTGIGMPEDVLRKIYEPFYSTKTGGLGLGLYVCKSIVEDHGGTLEVKSYQGKGTTFTVWLPIQSPAQNDEVLNKEIHYE